MGMASDEVKLLLDNMPDISQNTLKQGKAYQRFYDESYSWRFTHRKEYGGNILLRESKVIGIDFTFFRSSIPLSALIKKYGEPDKVLITKERIETTYIKAYFIYLEKGICLEHQPGLFSWPFSWPDRYRIKPSTSIDKILYIDPAISEGQTKIGCLEDPDNLPFVQDWNGYGIFSVHQPGSK